LSLRFGSGFGFAQWLLFRKAMADSPCSVAFSIKNVAWFIHAIRWRGYIQMRLCAGVVCSETNGSAIINVDIGIPRILEHINTAIGIEKGRSKGDNTAIFRERQRGAKLCIWLILRP